MKKRRLASLVLILSLHFSMLTPFVTKGQKTYDEMQFAKEEKSKGLKFRLSEAAGAIQVKKDSLSLVEGEKLSETEVNLLLSQIPPIKPEKPSDFSIRSQTLPSPKSGKTIPINFESSFDKIPPEETSSKALEIVRYSPEGSVSIVGDLSVTFSHPMVPVTSQEQASQIIPVKLTPQPEGKWRWLGTKTLIFDSEKRFPMATKFTATIPAGTKSINGHALQKDFTWTFTTPPPTITQTFPTEGSKTNRNPLVFIAFDQKIDPEAMIKSISVTSKGKLFPIRLATEEEISKDETIKEYVKLAKPQSWLVFRPINADGTTENVLPYDSKIEVTVQKGAPSAEGPLTTTINQSFSFRSQGAMRFVKGSCFQKKCSPFDDWVFEFTNVIDQSSFDPSMVKISPPIEEIQIYPAGNFIHVNGYKKGQTSYTITIDSSLQDIYGQKLDKAVIANITVGQSEPRIFSSNNPFIVLDPNSRPIFSFYSINLPSAKVSIYQVQPSDWYSFKRLVSFFEYNRESTTIPGRLVEQKTVKIQHNPDDLVETKIDLSKALVKGIGNAIVIIEPTINLPYDKKIITWCQATNLGVDVLSDDEELVAFVTDLKTGKPISDAQVEIYPDSTKGESDTNGIARIPFTSKTKTTKLLIVRKGDRLAFLPEEGLAYWDSTSQWVRKDSTPSLRWFIFDDRKTYKPKEEVSIKGYVRLYEGGKFGDVKSVGERVRKIDYLVSDSRGSEIIKGSLLLNSFGAFDLRFKLPDNINLGDANIRFTAETDLAEKTAYHSFQVQEFRRPEFEVKVKNESEPPYLLKETALVSVEAKYYAGGSLADANVAWSVSAKPANYTPPNRSDFFFGIWRPWWSEEYEYPGPEEDLRKTQTFKSQTNAAGKHVLQISFESIDEAPAQPYALEASVSVEDINRQKWASSTNLLVHPSSLYVGLRTKRNFVSKGDIFTVESIVTDIDGHLISNKDFQIIATLEAQRFDKGKWKKVLIDEQICNINSKQEISKCSFKANHSGKYTIKARILDDKNRLNETHIPVWVSGFQEPEEANVEAQKVEIIPDKTSYSVGDTAELFIISPFPKAEGVFTLDKNGIIKTEQISIRESSAIIKVPILEEFLPNIYARVDLVAVSEAKSQEDNQNREPAFAKGTTNLKISKATRSLNVLIEPEKKNLEPGGSTKINLEVKNFRGEPVANSEVALVVVDEAILALMNYRIPNPLDKFYLENQSGISDSHLREFVLVQNLKSFKERILHGEGTAIGGGAGMGVVSKSAMVITGESLRRPKDIIRKDFNPLALFVASLKTNSQGKATVDLKLPDNLTRYRVTAISADESGKFFGLGESEVTARKPLMIRPSLPRFLNFGDKAKLPVILQNQTENPMTVDLAIRAVNAELKGSNGKRVIVPANDRVEVQFPVLASQTGVAHFQFVASSGKWSDATQVSIPVWTPATTEAFATYGTINENEAILNKVIFPKNVYEEFGGLEITTSSTSLQELTDAFIYLCNHPFDSSESIASRIIAISAMHDVLKAFKTQGLPSDEAIKSKFEQDIKTLLSRQRDDGSFGIWTREDERFKYPFLTVHVTHALLRAKASGYNVPEDMLKKAMSYVKDVEDKFDEWHRKTPKLGQTVSAYALYVRNLAGDRDTKKALKLLNEAKLDSLPFEAIGWILSVLADDKNTSNQIALLKRFLMNNVTETASTANFVTDYEDGKWLIMHSNRRADAVILEALLKIDKENNLISKIVRGLLEQRVSGRWNTTQENVFILLALRKYFDTYENVTPDFIARIWLGETYVSEQKFEGRSTNPNSLQIPMSYLTKQDANTDLTLQKDGPGRLYYRIGMKYAPKDLKLNPVDYGFTVLRKYEPVDSPSDVKQNPDGSWTIKLGARVRVHLTLVAPSRRYHVALVDPLPAGLEILNPELAVTEKLPEKQNTIIFDYASRSFAFGFWWRRNWFEHQNFRDERAEVFSSLVWGGVYEFSYYTRATTPGEFIVPPTKAEEMYNPETFGRSSSDFVKIE
ncbi:MAG: hypothetical protein D6735_08355 [Acidobacteria bacterium]|nr:MAG: hypothetical protein D6735_08355 [Acidobacteriota bacterium]